MTDSPIDRILDFWFGSLDDAGMAARDRQALWFRKSEHTDRQCREQFGALVESALSGELDNWENSDQGLVALVLLLDQFTRNIYRDTARAFSGDAGALALASRAIASGRYDRLPTIHRVFILLPLEHAEDLAVQQTCVALFEALLASSGHSQIADFCRYARAHRDVIAQFGRFPHRNALLGRSSTTTETDYLSRHGGF